MNEMDGRCSVLIVDDDEALLEILKEMLSSEGYTCETATTGEAALDKLRKNLFEIVLADIALPGMTGFQLSEQAKSLCSDTAVIIMTGYIDDFSYDSAIEAGAADFIKKPFTLKELKARIEHVRMNARIQERQRAIAITDELTGLYNRRGFFTLVEQQFRLARRERHGIYMLYADLDGLKAINDALGHRHGDMALMDTAKILRDTFRESDLIARIGGDEFVVLPIGTTGSSVEKTVARLEENVNRHNLEARRKYKLSLSFGVAYYDPGHPCSIDELLAKGDRLMYEQKRLKQKS
jgi:two-component system cell cycle response regulator